MKWLVLFILSVIFANCGVQESAQVGELNLQKPVIIGKTMVLCLSPVDEFRTSYEVEMKRELLAHGVHAENSFDYIPKSLTQDNSTKIELEKLIKSLSNKGFSRLLISALTDMEHTKLDAEGYFGDFEIYHFTTNVFKLHDNGSSLMGSLCIGFYDYQLTSISVNDFAQTIVEKLFENGLINSNESQHLEIYSL